METCFAAVQLQPCDHSVARECRACAELRLLGTLCMLGSDPPLLLIIVNNPSGVLMPSLSAAVLSSWSHPAMLQLSASLLQDG